MRSIKLPAAEPPKNGVPPYPKFGEVKSRLWAGASRLCRSESPEFRLHPDRTCPPGPRAGSPAAAPREAGLRAFELKHLATPGSVVAGVALSISVRGKPRCRQRVTGAVGRRGWSAPARMAGLGFCPRHLGPRDLPWGRPVLYRSRKV